MIINSILHILDRDIDGQGTISLSEIWKKYIHKWNGIPVVFGDYHPNISEELPDHMKHGILINPYISEKGQPKMMGEIHIDHEPAIKLYDEGKLSVSIGYKCKSVENVCTEDIEPHHVLLFETTRYNQPRDKGAMLLNEIKYNYTYTKPIIMTKENIITSCPHDKTTADNKININTSTNPNPINWTLTSGNPNINTNFKITSDETIITLQKQVDEYKNNEKLLKENYNKLEDKYNKLEEKYNKLNIEMDKIRKAEEDKNWNIIYNKIPDGIKKEIKQEDMRKEFESDTKVFTLKLVDWLSKSVNTNKKQGFTHSIVIEEPDQIEFGVGAK